MCVCVCVLWRSQLYRRMCDANPSHLQSHGPAGTARSAAHVLVKLFQLPLITDAILQVVRLLRPSYA